MNLKKIVAEATIVGALGFSTFGLGAGIANAQPPSLDIPSWTTWPQDGHGHGHGGGGGHGWDWGPNWGHWGGNWIDVGDWIPPWWYFVPPPPPPPPPPCYPGYPCQPGYGGYSGFPGY
jgi:hypothetical protein